MSERSIAVKRPRECVFLVGDLYKQKLYAGGDGSPSPLVMLSLEFPQSDSVESEETYMRQGLFRIW